MTLQKEGVLLTAEGSSQFITQLDKATASLGKFAKTADGVGPTAQKASAGLSGLGESSKGLLGNLSKLGSIGGLAKGALGTAGIAAIGATAAIGGLAVSVGALGKALAGLATETAPIQGIAAQFGNLTQAVEGGTGGMLSALRAGSMGMIAQRDLMKQFNDAAALVSTQFAERLPDALGLLSKVALGTGEDMGFLLDSLTKGVGRVSPAILDNLKIQVGVAEATQRASVMFGKEADALTKLEQQTAIMDITLEKLREKFGDMPDATLTAQAQLGVFSARMQDIKDTLGQFLLPAFASFLGHVNRLAGAFLQLISEGGGLEPLLIRVGAALSIVGDAFGKAVDWVVDFVESLNVDASNGFMDFVDSAFEWGVNIVTSLADGMTQAATTVLDVAMQAIENALSFWLAPGSPPKVAPQLRNWGVDYMGELLGGMTEADWGVLEGIQGPLKKVLEGPAFAEASKAISESLVAGDRAGALDTIRKQTGAFGGELAELAQRQFELADATMAVEDAEKQLEAARQQQLASQQKVSEATATYNELLREGASAEILDAQLARINAAEQERDSAATASEDQLRLAQERKSDAEDEISLQQQIVDELLAYNDALTERAVARTPKGKGGAATPVEAAAIAPRGGGIDIAGRIGAAIDAAKGQLKEKFAGLFAPLGEAWDTGLAEIGKKWDAFVLLLGEAWTDIKTKWPGLQVLEDWIVGLPEKIGTMITDGWDKFLEILTSVWEFVDESLLPVLKDIWDVALLAIQGAILDTILNFQEWWDQTEGFRKFLDEKVMPLLKEAFPTALELLKLQYVDPLVEGFENLKTALKEAHTWFGNLITKLTGANMAKANKAMKWWRGESPSPMAIGIQTAADAMERMASVSLPKFSTAMAMAPAMMPVMRNGGATNTYNNQRTANVTIPTTINNGMDEAAFAARVRRVLRREMSN